MGRPHSGLSRTAGHAHSQVPTGGKGVCAATESLFSGRKGGWQRPSPGGGQRELQAFSSPPSVEKGRVSGWRCHLRKGRLSYNPSVN